MDATSAAPASGPVAEDRLAPLLRFENESRSRTDFAHAPTSDATLGPDPYVVRVAPWKDAHGSERLVGLLRGRDSLVELDAALHEVARLPAPQSPTGVAFAASGEAFVVGELSTRVERYQRTSGKLERVGAVDLPDVHAMRDVATGPEGVIYVVEEHDGRLVTMIPRGRRTATAAEDGHGHGTVDGTAPPAVRVDRTLCHGPLHVLRVAGTVLVDCLLDHAIVVLPVDARGFPMAEGEVRIVHDGPMWGMDAAEDGMGLLVAVGGVEDHPLDRTQGSFGYIDSFVTTYRVSDGHAVKLRAINTSAFGLVTPKALKLSRSAQGRWELAVAGYGSDRLAIVDPVKDDGPIDKTYAAAPGAAMMDRVADGSFVFADPLLDAWVRTTPASGTVETVAVDDSPSHSERPAQSRLGEALFFTTLMAPYNKSDGRLSRFTCETCHFEGYVDGRTHHTGRGDVHATTKPLLGLFNNRPHFSRALDPDLTTMVDNEFRVTGAKSDHDPWFSLSPADFPWASDLFEPNAPLGPEVLRSALMTFFMSFTHRPNPMGVGRTRLTDLEKEGAAVFRDKCESCHQARLVTDDASTRAPFADWETLVMAREGAIVWAKAEYEKTGVVPYVSDQGARVVSLRRLYKKYPYFTNGSAKDIRGVLERARFAGDRFFHDGAPEGSTPLPEIQKTALAAFVDLL